MTSSEPPMLEPVPPPAPPAPTPAAGAPSVISSSPAPQAVKPRLSAWIWVLAGVSALLLVGTGSVGFLYVDSRASHDRQTAERTARFEELTTKVSDLGQARSDLDRELDEVSADLETSEAELEGLSPCPDALNVMFQTDPDSAAFEDVVRAVFDACDVL